MGKPTLQGGVLMALAVKTYDTKVDSRNRLTLRNTSYEYFHVVEYDDGSIRLEPRVLTAPFQVSENTLNMMDESMNNYKNGKVSDAIDLSDFEE